MIIDPDMKLGTLVRLIARGQANLIRRVAPSVRQFYRISFVATAFREGIYRAIGARSASEEAIAESLGISDNYDGLKAWLDLRVSLGELSHDIDGYRVAGRLSRRLLSPANDAFLAFPQKNSSTSLCLCDADTGAPARGSPPSISYHRWASDSPVIAKSGTLRRRSVRTSGAETRGISPFGT